MALLVVPALAEANFVYWTNEGGTTIGRAKLNGTGVNNNFVGGLNAPLGVAVDSKFIYWAQGVGAASSIGRANLDGTGANPNFITNASGVASPNGVAVTSTHLFWSSNVPPSIGRANIDGSGPTANFINTGAGGHCGIAADSNFVYWTDTVASNVIGRAPAGGGAPQPSFIPGVSAECGVAVDSSFIYWGTETPLRNIGRAAIGGTGATNNFIPNATTAQIPCGVAVNSQYVFWGNKPATAIGRANLGGGSPNAALSPGASNPCLLAAAPSNKITITSKKLKKKKGTAVLTVKVPGPGQVTLSDSPAVSATVKQIGLTRTASGPFQLPLKPKGKTAKTLKKKGKAKVKAFITFIPAGVAGVPASKTVKMKLVRKSQEKEEEVAANPRYRAYEAAAGDPPRWYPQGAGSALTLSSISRG